jgi:hypothetical protein
MTAIAPSIVIPCHIGAAAITATPFARLAVLL